MRYKNLPGLLLAAAVVAAAVLALLLIDGEGPSGGPLPPATGDGQSLRLLPGGGDEERQRGRRSPERHRDAGREQYGSEPAASGPLLGAAPGAQPAPLLPGSGHDAGRAQYGAPG